MSCFCGFTGALCDTLLDGIADVDEVLNGTCFAGDCRAVDGSAVCSCDDGYRDDLCDRGAVALDWNYAVAIGLPVVVLGLAVWFAVTRVNSTVFEGVPQSAVTDSPWSWCGPKTIFAYRASVALFWMSLSINQLANRGFLIYKAFTIWTSTLLLTMLLLGTYLSFKSIRDPQEPGAGLTKAGKVYWTMQTVIVTHSMLIATVVWVVLLPASAAVGNEGNALNFDRYVFWQPLFDWRNGGLTNSLALQLLSAWCEHHRRRS